ncbi:MAG: tetratricopeptide repeat protein, partial [Nitrospirota bacterium]
MLLLTLPACSSRVARPSPPAKVPLPSREVIAGLLQNGKQAVAQGQYDRAIGLFRRLQDGYPNAPERPEATLLLAQVFEKRGETIQALVEYRKLASEFPQAPQATLARTKIPELERQLPIVRPPQESRTIGLHVGPD